MALPPIEFLLDASNASLQDLLITSLNRSANFSKTIRIEIDMWIEQEATAMLVRWLLENRQALKRPTIEPRRMEMLERGEEKKTA